MAMTEYQVIITKVFKIFSGVLNDRLFFFLKGIGSVDGATASRPAVGYPESKVRMKAGKCPLKKSVGKYPFQQSESMIALIQSIAMSQEEVLAIQCNGSRMSVQNDPGLLRKVIKHPDVMVAGKVVQPNPLVTEFRYLAEYPGISSWYHRFIFKPEVKQVAHEKYVGCMILYLIQKGYQLLFPQKAALIVGSPQVGVR